MSFTTFQIIQGIFLLGLILLAFPIFKAMFMAPFVPTPQATTQKMLAELQIQPGEILYDLGCGDGRFIRLASRQYQAKAFGVELNPLIYLYAKIRSFGYRNENFFCQDFMQINLSQADIIVCYLLPPTMQKLELKLNQELKQGAKIVSHGFQFKNWEPFKVITPIGKNYGKIFIYQKNN